MFYQVSPMPGLYNQSMKPLSQGWTSIVGLDDEEYEVFLEEELSSYDALFRAIRSPTLPAALALYYGLICVLPKPMRNLPLRITLGQMGSFDTRLREAVLSRLHSFPPP